MKKTVQSYYVLAALVEYHTQNNYNYDSFWFNVAQRDSIVFSVKAAGEAHIALAKTSGETDVTPVFNYDCLHVDL